MVGSVEGVHGESAVMEQHAKLRPISGETAIMINWNCWVDVLQLVVRGGWRIFFFFFLFSTLFPESVFVFLSLHPKEESMIHFLTTTFFKQKQKLTKGKRRQIARSKISNES